MLRYCNVYYNKGDMVWREPLSLLPEKIIITANKIVFKFIFNSSCQFSMGAKKLG